MKRMLRQPLATVTLLAVAGGIYARISLREMIEQPMPSSSEPSSGPVEVKGEVDRSKQAL